MGVPSDSTNWDYMSPKTLFEIIRDSEILEHDYKYEEFIAYLEVRCFDDFISLVEEKSEHWDDDINVYKDYDWEDYGRSVYKTGKPLKDLQKEAEVIKTYSHDERLKPIRKHFKGELPRLAEYIVKQNTDTSSYRDYYIACEQLKLDMSLPKNRYPNNFKRWHDIRIDEYNTLKLKEDEAKRKDFYCKFLDVANKYLSLQKEGRNYCVIIAKSPAELVKEGDYLHHCVGKMGYDQKFTREESLIFFIRLSSTPTVPLVTVEYSLSSHKILQCYGEHDSRPSGEILHFVNKVWLPYANKQIQSLAA